MADAESISLEETNKIRISLGLKPLKADSPPADSEDQIAERNYEQERERQRKEKEAERIKAAADKARNKRELNKRLKGATLGDADAEVDDVTAWLKASKRREKELAERRQRELENQDQVFQAEEYSEKDLQGLKVSHDLDAIDEGQERVLTLKDSRILDNEEDELFDEEMEQVQKDKKRHELKTKRRDYKGYDDEEFAAGGEFGKRSILAKYDEDINGASETGFRIGGPSRPTKKSQRAAEEAAAAAVNKTLLSIDYSKNLEITDYLNENEVGFKKPKTKKKRSTRKVEIDPDLLPPNGATPAPNGEAAGQEKMEVDVKPIISAPRVRDLDANFVDDDELQAALARSRRAKTAKVKKLSPEEIARQVLEEKREVKMESVEPEAPPAEDDGLTFDDTTEFIRNVTLQPVVVKVPSRPKNEDDGSRSVTSPRIKEEPMDQDEAMSEMEAGEVDEDEPMNDEDMLQAIEGVIKEAEAAVKEEEVNREIGITDEPVLKGAGLAGALSLLRQQGLIAKPDATVLEREKIQKERDAWLAEHRRRLALREMERMRSRGAAAQGTSASDAREIAKLYESYKPDVNIEYHDEFGRKLTPKEAWKMLSHRFHGKGSGRAKTEKRLKKIAEEKKREAMASGDTPTGMNEAFQARQQKIGQAHMVLSVGQRGAVPLAPDVLDHDALTKKPKEKSKKKESNKSAHITNGDPHGLINVTLPTSANLPASPATMSAEVSPSPVPGRTMKPAFARISSVEPTQSAPGSGGASPLVNGERTKVAFGLKRKAADEGEGTPPSKRR